MISYLFFCNMPLRHFFFFFFFNDTATTEIYTLSLHDALPICSILNFGHRIKPRRWRVPCRGRKSRASARFPDRKSTRLNSSHLVISYAVFCLKKKKKKHKIDHHEHVATELDSDSSHARWRDPV